MVGLGSHARVDGLGSSHDDASIVMQAARSLSDDFALGLSSFGADDDANYDAYDDQRSNYDSCDSSSRDT